MGALRNAAHSDDETDVYSEGVQCGGTLVSAKVPDDLAGEAEAVLRRNRCVDTGKRGEAYRQNGWSKFDENAPAYTSAEVERERMHNTTLRLRPIMQFCPDPYGRGSPIVRHA